MPISIGALYVYPVKSCRGIPLTEAHVGRMGIRHDRQWMVVDENGMFVAQRSNTTGVAVTSLCLVTTAIQGNTLRLEAPGMPPLDLLLAGAPGATRSVQVWNSHTIGVDQGDDAAGWVSTFISRERPGHYRVVRMPDHERRMPKRGESALAYGDGYPFLIASSASLADLNARLGTPLPMDRFRPNIVLDGCTPVPGGSAGLALDERDSLRGHDPVSALCDHDDGPADRRAVERAAADACDLQTHPGWCGLRAELQSHR